jgi:DNA-binding response OmpR family regulator
MDAASYKLENVHVLIVDSQATARNVTRNLLYETGFREIAIASSLEAARDHIVSDRHDLVIADANAEAGGICDLVFDVRHGYCGDPFLPIVMLSWEPTQEVVKKVIDTGADILMTMPSSTAKLGEAVETLIRRRKPFVVTSDYIGPDRRGKEEDKRKDQAVSTVNVPNVMRSKATGETPTEDHRVNCLAVIDEQKVVRTGDLVETLAREILDHFSGKKELTDVQPLLRRLNQAADDLKSRIHRSSHSHQADLCQTLLEIARRLLESPERPAENDLELLKQVSLALSLGMKSDPETSAAARDIVNEVRSAKMACGS